MLTASSALLSQSMLCGRLPRSSAMKSPGMGKFAHAAFNAAAGELVFAAADACLTLTTGLGLHNMTETVSFGQRPDIYLILANTMVLDQGALITAE